MMSKAATLLAALSAVLSVVNAHGSVNPFVAGGQTYVGPIPGSGSNQDTPVRAISTLEPINDVNSPAMACGPGASPSAQVTAAVNAGDNVEFGWRSGVSTIPWGHNLGPVLLYAYKCPGAAADCGPPTGAEWFLIDAAGADPNAGAVPDSTGWVQARFHVNMTVPVKIPAGMPNGDYLFRHEIIALHRGGDIGGAEFYVSCTQVKVSGGANGTPQSAGAKFVAHPGAYQATDPGIHVNVFGDFNINNYQMPGPEVFTGGNGGGNGGTVNTGENPSGSGTGTPPSTGTSNDDGDYSTQPPAATPSTGSGNGSGSGSGSGSGGSCKVVKSRKAKRNMSKRTVHQRQQAHIAGLAGRKYPARMQY